MAAGQVRGGGNQEVGKSEDQMGRKTIAGDMDAGETSTRNKQHIVDRLAYGVVAT